jgi:hypothetical protein
MKLTFLCAQGWCSRAKWRAEPGRHVVQVNTDDISRIQHAKPCRDARTNVAALCKVSFRAKHLQEIVPKFSDMATVGPWTFRGRRKPEPGQRRNHDVKCVTRIATIAFRVGQVLNEHLELEERTGPAMCKN